MGAWLAGYMMLSAGPLMAAASSSAITQPAVASDVDLTGYWVSVVSEDWRYRMVTPGRGEYAGIPINQSARAAADAWDPAQDERAQEQCKSYGAAALMRVPGRLRISRVDANTIKVEMDSGTQTRLLHLDTARSGVADSKLPDAPTWQGYSKAAWEEGTLKVVTRNLRPGYLRKNGVPYSAQAELTEYWDTYRERDGSEWLVITSLVTDPFYLQDTYGFSPHFRREKDGSKWRASPCQSQ